MPLPETCSVCQRGVCGARHCPVNQVDILSVLTSALVNTIPLLISFVFGLKEPQKSSPVISSGFILSRQMPFLLFLQGK